MATQLTTSSLVPKSLDGLVRGWSATRLERGGAQFTLYLRDGEDGRAAPLPCLAKDLRRAANALGIYAYRADYDRALRVLTLSVSRTNTSRIRRAADGSESDSPLLAFSAATRRDPPKREPDTGTATANRRTPRTEFVLWEKDRNRTGRSRANRPDKGYRNTDRHH